jgi:hypothetical protein
MPHEFRVACDRIIEVNTTAHPDQPNSANRVSNSSEMLRTFALVWIMFSTSVPMFAQSPTIQIWISGDVTVATSESLTHTAVKVRGRMVRDSVRSGEHEVVFCLTHAQPIASKLTYMGAGRVVYRAPRIGKSAATGPGAEKMLPALGVLQVDGESRFFLAEGQGYPHPPNERSVGSVSTFAVVEIVREDVHDPKGKRQLSDGSSCLESNGPFPTGRSAPVRP